MGTPTVSPPRPPDRPAVRRLMLSDGSGWIEVKRALRFVRRVIWLSAEAGAVKICGLSPGFRPHVSVTASPVPSVYRFSTEDQTRRELSPVNVGQRSPTSA